MRVIFLHTNRVADLILTLKFDHFLVPKPEKTIILYGPHDLSFDLIDVLKQHNIDTSTFEILPDHYMWQDKNIEVDIYQFGGWISQQFIKFIALDTLNYQSHILIQDCDTFNIVPYHWLSNNKPNMYVTEPKELKGLREQLVFLLVFIIIQLKLALRVAIQTLVT